MTAQTIMTMEIDCHAYPWHVREEWMGDDYPEVGPDNLVRMSETFAILIEFLPDHPLASWAWWYRITGPRAHIVHCLSEEWCGGVEEAEEMVPMTS